MPRFIIPCALAALCLPPAVGAARDPAPGFDRLSVELPGMPAVVRSADLDRDGRQDLVVLVAYRRWDSVAEVEQTSFDGIEGLVEVMNVVDALVDRRELRVYPGAPGGHRFGPRFLSLELSTSVHALATGHPAHPLVALTDDGVAAVEIEAEAGSPGLVLRPLIARISSLAGRGVFYSDVPFLARLDGDPFPELLLPVAGGWEVHRGLAAGFAETPSAVLRDPRPAPESERRSSRGRFLLPTVHDVDGDGRLDLYLLDRDREEDPPVVWLQGDGLAFGSPVTLAPESDDKEEEIVFVGDLDRDRRSELVTRRQIELPDDAGFRLEIADAKHPHFAYRLWAIEPDLDVVGPLQRFEAIGYTFAEGGDDDIELPGGFQDLDGDGRLDLISITLDFSVLPMLAKILVVRRLSLRLDFHPWCQDGDGRWLEVPNLDLSGRFKINLRNTQVKHLSQFAGDFNGDGRADFVQLGRGRNVSLHFGRRGCRYPAEPDRTLRLAREPKHLGLVRILDLDLDGLSDLLVVHPRKPSRSDESVPARVDLYLGDPDRLGVHELENP